MKTLLPIMIAIAALLAGCSQSSERHAELRRRAAHEKEIADSLAKRRSVVVYPYSVIAGGVETSEDVAEAMGRDPEVAAHYSDVNIASLRPARWEQSSRAYVSFRKRGKVYWTRRPVHIAAGEPVLSDGKNCIRGRCGNRISSTPRTPVLPEGEPEPESVELITPSVRGRSIEELPVPPIIGELMPSKLPPNGLPPSIVSASSTVLPGFLGGVVSTPGGGGASGGGGGGGAGVVPGSSIDDSRYITGGPVVFVTPGFAPGAAFPSAPPVTPPGPAPLPPLTSVIWTPALPYVPAQVTTAPPGVPVGQPPATVAWNPPAWIPPSWNPPSTPPDRPGDNPPGPPRHPTEEPWTPPWSPPEWPPDCPPVVPPDKPDPPIPPPPSDVPEPATLLTVSLAFGALAWRKRRSS